ncbi:hypothetical protein GGQ57_001835 [Parabacteroides faecis]|uniref:Uncharacterized protein n=1 Tax=Parabacteroides faecis TaxID=1217282 RepID=A0ABR6KKQ9_9BACT|nr:hypothetical protein [Parabacteroides faecis]
MKTIRVICNFLLSLVHALFPRGLKERHSCPGNPVAGADSTAVAPAETNGSRSGRHRGDPVAPSSPEPSGPSVRSPTAGNLLGWLLIGAAAVKLFC